MRWRHETERLRSRVELQRHYIEKALDQGVTPAELSEIVTHLAFYTGCKMPASWIKSCNIDFTDHQQVLRWFRQEFTGWHPIWEELFHNAHSTFIPRPQYSMPIGQPWPSRPNITLIGDAAHVMPPYAGEGVNMAMLDALELSEYLTSATYPDAHPNIVTPAHIPSAIAHYESAMHKRAAQITQVSLDQMQSMHGPGAIANLLNIFAGH